MNIVWSKKTIVFSELDPFIAGLLSDLPKAAETDPDDPADRAAYERLYSTPTGGADEEMDEEWREHVEPGLHELFASHLDILRADLAPLSKSDDDREADGDTEGEATLTIPTSHAPAWIHTLNQARLALAARHDLGELEIEGDRPPKNSEAALALLQIEIYGAILQLLLRNTEI